MPSLIRRTKSGFEMKYRPKTTTELAYCSAAVTAVSGLKPPAMKNGRGVQISCCATAEQVSTRAKARARGRFAHEEVEVLLLGGVDRRVARDAGLDGVDVGEVRVTLAELGDQVGERLLDVREVRHLHPLEGRVGREADADAVGADCIADGLGDLEREARAVLERAAVLVRALVRVGLEELVEEVACVKKGVSGRLHQSLDRSDALCACVSDHVEREEQLTVGVVDLDTVTAGLLDKELGRVRVVADVVLDLLLGQRAGLGSSLERHVGRRDDVGVKLLLEVVGVGGAAERPELEVDVRTLGVDLVYDLLPRRDLLLVVASGDL